MGTVQKLRGGGGGISAGEEGEVGEGEGKWPIRHLTRAGYYRRPLVVLAEKDPTHFSVPLSLKDSLTRLQSLSSPIQVYTPALLLTLRASMLPGAYLSLPAGTGRSLLKKELHIKFQQFHT